MTPGRHRPAGTAAAASAGARRSAPSLADLIAAAATPPAEPSANERELSDRLLGLGVRLLAHRFQLAVVGQFKRGKSSLLNALLGQDALPTGILPLTALPTFIRAGRGLELEVQTISGETRHFRLSSAAALQEALAEFVAERANPGNVKGVRQVDVALPSPLLDAGVVLIDTPGVGSTVSHNTHAAEGTLPECDAALMVLSPEPPITQAELDYLQKVRVNAVKVLIAFNKVDTATPSDIDVSIGFLRDVLRTAGLPEAEVFPVSARRALTAISDGDEDALAESGLPALRDRLVRLAESEGGRLLTTAIARKASGVASALAFENDLVLAALTTPIEDLDRRAAAFDQARIAFDRERRAAADRIEGDRRRLLQQLDIDADRLTEQLRARLSQDVAERAEDEGPRAAWDQVRAAIPARLAELQVDFVRRHREALEAALADHQSRADTLLDELRQTAADLMHVAYQTPAAGLAFVPRAEPYWIDRPRESLADGPADLVERLTPGPWGRRLARRRVQTELSQVAVTNVEHLRWACRQNLEDSLRQFAAELDKTLVGGAASIADGLAAAAQLRRCGEAAAKPSVAGRTHRRARLQAVVAALDQPTSAAGED